MISTYKRIKNTCDSIINIPNFDLPEAICSALRIDKEKALLNHESTKNQIKTIANYVKSTCDHLISGPDGVIFNIKGVEITMSESLRHSLKIDLEYLNYLYSCKLQYVYINNILSRSRNIRDIKKCLNLLL
jgi:hypothetical protein